MEFRTRKAIIVKTIIMVRKSMDITVPTCTTMGLLTVILVTIMATMDLPHLPLMDLITEL